MARYQVGSRTAGCHSFTCMGVIGTLLAAAVAWGAEPLLSEKLMPADPVVALFFSGLFGHRNTLADNGASRGLAGP